MTCIVGYKFGCWRALGKCGSKRAPIQRNTQHDTHSSSLLTSVESHRCPLPSPSSLIGSAPRTSDVEPTSVGTRVRGSLAEIAEHGLGQAPSSVRDDTRHGPAPVAPLDHDVRLDAALRGRPQRSAAARAAGHHGCDAGSRLAPAHTRGIVRVVLAQPPVSVGSGVGRHQRRPRPPIASPHRLGKHNNTQHQSSTHITRSSFSRYRTILSCMWRMQSLSDFFPSQNHVCTLYNCFRIEWCMAFDNRLSRAFLPIVAMLACCAALLATVGDLRCDIHGCPIGKNRAFPTVFFCTLGAIFWGR